MNPTATDPLSSTAASAIHQHGAMEMGDKKDDGEFSVTKPENDAEKQAMEDHFEDDSPEPSKEEVNERMGTKF